MGNSSTNLISETSVRKVVAFKGRYHLIEYEKDISTNPAHAMQSYFAAKMNIRKRQVVAEVQPKNGVIMQAGAMQIMLGDVSVKTDVKGVGDFAKKIFSSKVTGETAIKPLYTGDGIVVLEPTYKYILFEDLNDWHGSIVIEDGMFLACDESVNLQISARKNISSAVLGGEGLFNTKLTGKGVVVLESNVPRDELVYVDMENDVLKIDGSMAIAWSDSLEFTVERTTKTLIGSAVSGEGFVNVYRGTGRVLMALV